MNAVLLRDLIFRLAQASELTEVPPDLTGLTAGDGRQLVEHVRRAYQEIYETPFPWPECIRGETVTVTDGKFATSVLDEADWWEAWSEDPRPVTSKAVPVETRIDSDGIWPRTTAGTVFVLSRLPAPDLVYDVVDGGGSYVTDQVVYDPVTGDCYQALVDAPDASDLSVTSEWRRLELMRVLQEATLLRAEGYASEKRGETERAERLFGRARARREREFTKVFETGRYGAWWRDRQ